MKITVYFEAPAGAHEVAVFFDELLYTLCVPALEEMATAQGYVLSESVTYGEENDMKRFVIFGTIEYIDNTALIHTVLSAEHIADADIESRAIALDNCDWLAPHYYDGKIMFMQYHEEETQ